jgi:hypothetical protein
MLVLAVIIVLFFVVVGVLLHVFVIERIFFKGGLEERVDHLSDLKGQSRERHLGT